MDSNIYIVHSILDNYFKLIIMKIVEIPIDKSQFTITTFITQTELAEMANDKNEMLRLYCASKCVEIFSPYNSLENKIKSHIEASMYIQSIYN